MKFYNLILDRSGSMSSIWNEITKAVNDNLERKAKNSLCSLLLFDTQGLNFISKYDTNPKYLNKNNFNPRGGTPLRDAIMYNVETFIKDWGDFLFQDFIEVEFVIFTDGEENSSHIWKSEDIARAINHFQKEYNWKFTFIGHGSNTDVMRYAAEYGIKNENTISYQSSKELDKVFANV